MKRYQKQEMTRFGLYGLMPFVASAVALWLSPWLIPQYIALDFHQLSLVYGGIIIAYLAGIGAGGLMQSEKQGRGRSFLPSILITLLAFGVIIPNGVFFVSLGAAWRHLIIFLMLIYLYLRDINSASMGLLPVWYSNLRARLTLLASLSVALIGLRLLLWGLY